MEGQPKRSNLSWLPVLLFFHQICSRLACWIMIRKLGMPPTVLQNHINTALLIEKCGILNYTTWQRVLFRNKSAFCFISEEAIFTYFLYVKSGGPMTQILNLFCSSFTRKPKMFWICSAGHFIDHFAKENVLHIVLQCSSPPVHTCLC